VSLHDVEPRTFERVREIRAWLAAHGIDRVTLAVIPAADLHSVGIRSPMLASWLRARTARGDAVAQHGLQHRGVRAEFAHLGADEARGRVEAGLTMLRDVELDPYGFIAPAYGYTPALRVILRDRFSWFGERARVSGPAPVGERPREVRAPALGLGGGTARSRVLSPLLRGRASVSGALMRLDVHPADFDRPVHVRILEQILARAADRRVVTYDDVFCH
jgi:hypothetical protein